MKHVKCSMPKIPGSSTTSRHFPGCSDPQSFAQGKIRHIRQHKSKSTFLSYLKSYLIG